MASKGQEQGSDQKVLPKAGLTQLLGTRRQLPEATLAKNLGPGDRFWACQVSRGGVEVQQTLAGKMPQAPSSADARLPRMAASGLQLQKQSEPPLSARHSTERLSVAQLLRWVEGELQFQGQRGKVSQQDRIRIFSSAFAQVVDVLPEYRPLLLAVQREYEEMISFQQEQLDAIAPLEGRLKTVKADSYSFICQSSTMLQSELSFLRQRLAALETERGDLQQERAQLLDLSEKLKDKSEKDRIWAHESHMQNLDIIKYLERMEKSVEMLRKQEHELQIEKTRISQRLKEKDARIHTVEEQLNLERDKCNQMVPKEELEAVRDEVRQLKLRNKELEEAYNAKQKDYMSIVETYSKSIGQSITGEVRPLTPRPTWQRCHGLLDAELPGSCEKAFTAQDILQKMFVSCRTILGAYGLSGFSQKSHLLQTYARNELATFLAPDRTHAHRGAATSASLEGDGSEDPDRDPYEEPFFPPSSDSLTPWKLRHADKIKNQNFSRKRTSALIESLLHLRLRDSGQHRPFLDFMLEHLPKEVKKEDAVEFCVNVWMSIRRFAAEPDFMAYMLLMLGKIGDHVVRDNRRMVKELLALFSSIFESSDGTKRITKQKFIFGIREVLPNKDKEMCQAIVQYCPAGGPEVLVNYEALLHDDVTAPSPVAFAIRHQHLEEALGLSERMEKVVQSCVQDGSNVVLYGTLAEACSSDHVLSTLQPEDFAKAFHVPMASLDPHTEKDASEFLDNLRQSSLFHTLYFPELPTDDAEDGEGDDGGGDMN